MISVLDIQRSGLGIKLDLSGVTGEVESGMLIEESSACKQGIVRWIRRDASPCLERNGQV